MKISVIMQVFLGEYPNSRENARRKFIRAVTSFLNQSHPDKELIIISDNCPVAKKIYTHLWLEEKEIKFFYLKKTEKEHHMYSLVNEENSIYLRHQPKNYGLKVATGKVITYLNSDDIMLPDHLWILNMEWEGIYKENVHMMHNGIRILNKKYLTSDYAEYKNIFDTKPIDLSCYGIHEEFVANLSSFYDKVIITPGTFSHKKIDNEPIWNDKILNIKDNKYVKYVESMNFTKEFITKYKNIHIYTSPTYVVGHYYGIWDN